MALIAPAPGSARLTVVPETRPLVVIEGPRTPATERLAETLELLRADGWRILRGWGAPMRRDRLVCTGWVRSSDDARRALLAAVAGAGLVVALATDGETIDRFLDYLRRLGAVDHQALGVARDLPGAEVPRANGPAASASSGGNAAAGRRAILGLLAEGLTIDEAAAELGITRGSAMRRVAAARRSAGD